MIGDYPPGTYTRHSTAEVTVSPDEQTCAGCGCTIPHLIDYYEVYVCEFIGVAFLETTMILCEDCTERGHSHHDSIN